MSTPPRQPAPGLAFLSSKTTPPADAVPLHPRVLAVINGKGGVGKTSIAANVAGQAARDGLRVCLIDLDPQGNVALELGLLGREDDDPLATDHGAALYEAVRNGTTPRVIIGVRSYIDPESGQPAGRLDVVAGGPDLDVLAASLVTWQGNGEDRLTPAISRAAWGDDSARPGGYDLIVLDCPPGIEVIQKAALAAARFVVIPAKSDAASRDGLTRVARGFQAAMTGNPDLTLLGVVHFAVNLQAKNTLKEARKELLSDLAGGSDDPQDLARAEELVFPARIRSVEAASTMARRYGLLVHELLDVAAGDRKLAVQSTAGLAEDYAALAKQIVDRILDHERAIDDPAN